jgi:MSHA biogenesis protein MshL
MRRTLSAILLVFVAACAQVPQAPQKIDDRIVQELNKAMERKAPVQPDTVTQALMPALRADFPKASAPIEPRFDLVVNNAPAQQVFLSIVSGTRYSMLVHPSVAGVISVNLKDVTISEAMDSIREVYGYEYRTEGTRIYVLPAGLQTRVFQVNYLIGARQGRSDMRVSTGSGTGALGGASAPAISGSGGGGQTTTTIGGQTQPPSLTPGGAGALGGLTQDASRMSTVQLTDFWAELSASLRAIIGQEGGRSVVISPQSGVVVVRALPGELRGVETFLKAMKLSVERQVMLEAKIIDVTLNDSYQAGINWGAFPTSGIAAGFTNSNNNLSASGALSGSSFTANPTSGVLAGIGLAATAANPGGIMGLALQTRNFAALLQFLESQGSAQVLSSPRVATLNNQKAVLKVGTDQLFVTNVTPGTPGSANVPGTSPAVTLGSIFSGISLDITPQIDAEGNITLHVHPLFSRVLPKTLNLNLGTGQQSVEVPSIEISESDTIVRTTDGNIVALGGLMRIDVTTGRGGVPGLQDAPVVGGAFRNTSNSTVKRELVILIKPTIITGDSESVKDLQDVRERLQNMDSGFGPENK